MTDIDNPLARRTRKAAAAQASRRDILTRGAGLGLSAAALAAGMSRGAGAAPGPGAGRTRALGQETTLSLYHDKTPWQDFFGEMGELSAEAIGIGIEASSFDNTTTYQATLLPALSSDEAPDLFTWWSGFRIEDLYQQEALTDVSDIWTQAIADGNLIESLNSGFTFDGKQYGIPSALSYWVVFYNIPVFAENGLTPPTTWDEMLAAAETLKGAGITPFAATQDGRWPSFIWFEELVLRTDPAFYQALTTGQAKYTDPTAVQAMETWRGLIENEYFTPFDLDLTNDFPSLMAQGEVGMLPIGSWYQSTLIPAGLTPGEDYGIFIMPNVNPAVTEKVLIVETGALAIPRNAPDVEASKQFATWWLSPEAQTVWCNKLGDTPANPKAQSENPILGDLLTTINDGYTLYQRYWEASPVPIVESAVDFLAEFMLNPDDAQSVLEKIEELAAAEWAKRQ